MITPFQVYLLTRLDAICFVAELLVAFSLISGILYAFSLIAGIIEGIEGENDPIWIVIKQITKPLRNTFFILTSLAIVTKCFIPSTKEMAAVIIIPKVANSEKIQGLNTKIYDLAVEWMEELRPQKLTNQKADNPQSRKKGD